MHREGHIGLGHLLYSPLAFVLALSEAWTLLALGLVGVTFFSYAPDFDLQMPLVNHRGITHTYLAAGIAGVLSMLVLGWLAVAGVIGAVGGLSPLVSTILVAGFGFLIGALGVLSHLLGDVLTPMGINPWQPFGGETVSLSTGRFGARVHKRDMRIREDGTFAHRSATSGTAQNCSTLIPFGQPRR